MLKIAQVTSELSNDSQTKVGSVLVNKDTLAILSTGRNGFCRGCNDDKLPNTRPLKYPFILHAEQNLITNAARHGIKTDGAFCVQTLSPCFACARLLYQSGITEVYFGQLYHIYTADLMFPLSDTHYLIQLDDLTLQIKDHGGFFQMNIKPTEVKFEKLEYLNE